MSDKLKNMKIKVRSNDRISIFIKGKIRYDISFKKEVNGLRIMKIDMLSLSSEISITPHVSNVIIIK